MFMWYDDNTLQIFFGSLYRDGERKSMSTERYLETEKLMLSDPQLISVCF